MQQRHSSAGKRARLFTASEVAEFEYCPLVWWYQQYEPLAQLGTEELFARLVELEHENGTEAPALPEYQVIEQLLLRQGAFEEGQAQHLEHAEEVEAVQEERITTGKTIGVGNARLVAIVALVILVLALALIGIAILLPSFIK
ncbi:MAG TPA: hypothetical protein VGN15_08825 [Ktedonobacteraceae bacterium]|nr:hypothetical protein [Ktedonobacteraceae bacterium]